MASRIDELLDVLRVPPGKQINLKKDYDPGFTGKWVKKQDADEVLAEGVQQLLGIVTDARPAIAIFCIEQLCIKGDVHKKRNVMRKN